MNMTGENRKRIKTARRIAAAAFAVLILAQNAFLPKSRAEVVPVEATGQRTFYFWLPCDDMQKWAQTAGDGTHTRIMMINDSEYFFDGTTADARGQGNEDGQTYKSELYADGKSYYGFECGHSLTASDMPNVWASRNASMFMTESGMNTPYIQYYAYYAKTQSSGSRQNNKGYELHTWRMRLADKNDRQSKYYFCAPSDQIYSAECLGYTSNADDADFPWFVSDATRFFNYAGSRHVSQGLVGNARLWYLKDFNNTSNALTNNSGTKMKVFLGVKKNIDCYDVATGFQVANDQITVAGRKMEYIPEEMTVTVKSGGVLTVEGALINDGKIVVEDGGLLVIRKDAVIMPLFFNKPNRGGITSAGNIIIRSGGALIGGGANGIYLSGGSVVNFGLMASENFTAKNDNMIDNRGGQIYAGKTVDGSVVSKFTRDIYYRNFEAQSKSFKVSDITESHLTNYLSGSKASFNKSAVYGTGTVRVYN